VKAIAIGASTGGPLVLQSILAALPLTMPVPLLIVQHMAPGFVESFAEWLGRSSGFPVHIAVDGAELLPGHAYVAPDDRHMGVRPGGRIVLSAAPAENGLRPAVSFLFRSLKTSMGADVAAVLLTGMGRDGVDELKQLRQAGALTIAQDEKSSVVFGMPGQAVEAGAVSHVLPPDDIASLLATLNAPD
jgi:two-component system chemotaxis response regulator CheB